MLLNNVVRQQGTVKTIQTEMPNKPDVTEEKVKIFSQSSTSKLTLIVQDELEDSAHHRLQATIRQLLAVDV